MYLNFYNLVSEPFDITPDPALEPHGLRSSA